MYGIQINLNQNMLDLTHLHTTPSSTNSKTYKKSSLNPIHANSDDYNPNCKMDISSNKITRNISLIPLQSYFQYPSVPHYYTN